MDFKYKLEVKASISVDGTEVSDNYEEEGLIPITDIEELEEYTINFFKPRVDAAGSILTGRMNRKFLKKCTK